MAQLRGATASLRSPAAAEMVGEVLAPGCQGGSPQDVATIVAQRFRSRVPQAWTTAELWRWRNTLSFAWQNEHNISTCFTCEMLAALAEIRRPLCNWTPKTRFLHILDSQVVYHILAKGRAYGKRLIWLARRVNSVRHGTLLIRPLDALLPTIMASKLHWAEHQIPCQLSRMPITVKELDFALSEFMNESFQKGDSPGYAGAAVSALKSFLPRLRLRLYTTTQLYSNWVKVYKPCRATPLTKPRRVWFSLLGSSVWLLPFLFNSFSS